ncbi:class II histone deacetylase [Wenxinia saemankumensis]|uniref:Acetoin utilization deacetylase AcuC n=1 Tax=Wenxinia saemankumensis TaxID=1447782 RepID=A0A1M6CBG1_9RHOB|nr:class II histone deacetylase [Wenxinia saemankumensis]SHI58124.1 Acetoin utilization deacetylase AcuC [Wenxinia saemankumensis]
MTTGFFTDERCFWHGGGYYANMMPVGGMVQPMASGGLPENPETKRRLRNMMEVSGLLAELSVRSAAPASRQELERVHDPAYLDEFRRVSDAGGGEIGLRAPFGPGGYEVAALSAGLARDALLAVLSGELEAAYALSRPPGHHATRDWANGFCLINNIAVAVEAARAAGLARRIAVLDWDVHHGNGTEAIFLDDPDILTLSLHQERNYPLDTGGAEVRGAGGANVNVPLPAGTGHAGYLEAMERIALPAIRAHRPEAIVVACGFDAAPIDPLGRMLATVETYRHMTRAVQTLAREICDGRLVLVHEGGYSELYVPFCGHATIEELSGSAIRVADPMAATYAARQPGPAFDGFVSDWIGGLARTLGI